MRILMLGNSFTYYNDMPSMLAELLDAQVVPRTRGGAYLAEQLDPVMDLGAGTVAALENEAWDYVILQEQSNAAITANEAFQSSVSRLCEMARHAGAVPVLYATWAYQKGSHWLDEIGLSYEEMAQGLYDAYHQAAEKYGAAVADVGRRFLELSETQNLYAEDGMHPNETGSRIAAEIIAGVVGESVSQRDILRESEGRSF